MMEEQRHKQYEHRTHFRTTNKIYIPWKKRIERAKEKMDKLIVAVTYSLV
jgi:hypothetical protein